MSFKKMLIHKCDVYHLQNNNEEVKFGVPTNTKQTYNAVPDLLDVQCYFSKDGRMSTIVQADPNAIVSESLNVFFPKNTDVRVNDKVLYEGTTYKLKTPRKVRNHHIEVEAVRVENL